MTTPLARLLMDRIAAAGPLTVADFMTECLLHPEHGYYTTRPPFGAEGDFITAPEISQMFGELIGLSLAQVWMDQDRPAPFVLAELGPGRGTLMADVLRATKSVPGFHAAAQVVFVEASPALRAEQAQRVPGATWVGTVAELPAGPLYVVANEFFDALPIRQFQRAGRGWSERVVAVRDGGLRFALAPPAPVPALATRLADTCDGDIVEFCPMAAPIVTTLATQIAQQGGAALFVDYGNWAGTGDTLQALADHAPVDPLATPGTADITAHVDFAALAAAAAPRMASAMVPQGVVLERWGITQRAQTLARSMSGTALESHIAAHRRLTHPDEMGLLFKMLAMTPPGRAGWPGLEPWTPEPPTAA